MISLPGSLRAAAWRSAGSSAASISVRASAMGGWTATTTPVADSSASQCMRTARATPSGSKNDCSALRPLLQ